ncbi:hypothetical protein DFLDMN_001063 [Cupriavidus sp. H19C3]|uniref:hypothetical protein n=1 Tax=Cupriavidus sp. H19C3 TaxID=3241603 RepID=UPI003BF85AF7
MATKVKVLRVVSRTDRFRRAGHEFGAEPKIIPVESLSEDQLTALKGESNLVVVEVEVLMDDAGNMQEVGPAGIDDAHKLLQEWAEELNARHNELQVREDAVKKAEASVKKADDALTDREDAVAKREQAIADAAKDTARGSSGGGTKNGGK